MTQSMQQVPAFSFGAVPETKREAQKTFLVRIAHPQEQAIVALLEDVATGGEDVASKTQEALRLLQEDGVFASFSTHQIRGGVVTDEPFRDWNTGLIALPKDQVLIYGRKPGNYGDEGQVIYRSWDSGRARKGFVQKFMDFANSQYRASIGLPAGADTAKNLEQIPAGHAPVGPGGQPVRLS